MKKILYILTLLVTFFSPDALSQGSITTQGKEFYVAFGANYIHAVTSLELQIRIVATNAATVTLTFTETGATKTINVPEGGVHTYKLSNEEEKLVYNNTGGRYKKSLHVSSDEYISVFALNQASATTDATNVLPVNNLGTSYYHLSYSSLTGYFDGYTIVATEDNTQVYRAGTLLTTLDRGEVYSYYQISSDLTGTHITSDKPIAYFTTNSCVNIPIGKGACDCLYQQMGPESTWGNTFLVPVTSQGVERIRVLASQNGTTITHQGGTLMTNIGKGSLVLNAGEFAEIEVRTADKGCYIVADKPVAVGSFLTGVDYVVGNVGDPALSWVPPIEQTVVQVSIAPFIPTGESNLTEHYALLVTKTVNKGETKMGVGAEPDNNLTGGTWIDHPSGYSFYSLQMTNNTAAYTFANPEGLTVMGYGVGSAESYYYLAAASSRKLDAFFNINEAHYQDYNKRLICGATGSYEIKGVVQYPMSGNPGDIRWLVNGVEEVAARDRLTWTLNSITPDIATTITMRVTNNVGEVEDLSTTFTVSSIQTPTISPSGTRFFFANSYATLTSSAAHIYQWYLNGVEITGATSQTYNANEEGMYTVRTTNLSGCVSEASLPVMVKLYPDNISEEDCYVTPPVTNWKPGLKAVSDAKVHILAQPYVGDIDGDGKREVVTTNYMSRYATSDSILIFDNDLKLKKRFATKQIGANSVTPMVLVRLKASDTNALIVVATDVTDGHKLRAYDPDGNEKWVSDSSFFISTDSSELFGTPPSVSLVVADINNDGIPEILAVDGIFNAANGKLIAKLPEEGGRGYRPLNGDRTNPKRDQNPTYMPALADMDNDGKLEVVTGNTTYKVNIADPDNFSANSVSVLATAKGGLADGFVSVADIDLDGQQDVITVIYGLKIPTVAVWNGVTGEMIAGPVNPSVANTGGSRAFIGDVDKDGYPEIFFSYAMQLVGFDYDPSKATVAGRLVQKWITGTSDASGGTTLSMFDFDQNNEAELIYRDQDSLRIINGNNGENRLAISCYSATHTEYPIIVDFDDDGHADILVSGAASGDSYTVNNDVHLYWFRGESNDWAPARRVWNQHGYNSVHVNDDLTIPKYQMNPSTVFTGKDGMQTLRPYNGYLLQQTSLSKDGEMLFLTPNAQIVSPETITFDYDMVSDKLVISGLKIENIGSAALNAPVKIAVYKDAAGSGNNIMVHTYGTAGTSIPVGIIVTVPAFEVPSFSSYLPATNLIIKVNDNGNGQQDQPACEECEPKNSSSFSGIDFDALAWAEPFRNCIGGTVQFKSATLNAATYEWIQPDGTQLATTKDTGKTNLVQTDGGRYTFKVTGVNGDLSLSYKLPHLSVAPQTMYWKQDAVDNNWNNIDNWAASLSGTALITKAVPAPCTSVHIPGKADNYPSLDETTTPTDIYGKPEVDNITFHYRSELAYQHKLKYRKAFVQYNFGYYDSTAGGTIKNFDNDGSPVMGRDKWYVLAAPLKNIASGDFALGGYPFSWQVKHEVASIGNGSLTGVEAKAYKTNDVNLAATYNAISLKMAGYNASNTGYKDHKNLEGLKGIIEVPYFENSAVGQYRPGHGYEKFTGKSTFYYYNTNTLQTIHSPVGTMQRGDEAYRFIYENENNDVPAITALGGVAGYTLQVAAPAGSGNRVLIGNPFMASINAENFYEANSSVISGTTYLVYNSMTQVWESIAYNDATKTNINSFQSFIVTLNTGNATLYFPLEGQYALTGTGQVGNVPMIGGFSLGVQVADNEGNGEKAMLTSRLHSDVTSNVEKVVSLSEKAVPEIFFIDGQVNQYNLIQLYNSGVAEVGVGVKASETGKELTLNFSNVAKFVSGNDVKQLVLVDKFTGNMTDLTKVNTYTFTHKGEAVDGQYVDTDRFVLKMADAITGKDIQIYYYDNAIRVEGMNVDYVNVFNMSGSRIYKLKESELNYVPLNQGAYIIQAFGKEGEQKTEKVIAR